MGQRKTKIEQAVAQDIYDYITKIYQTLKGHDTCCVFYSMIRNYMNSTYLQPEKDGEN